MRDARIPRNRIEARLIAVIGHIRAAVSCRRKLISRRRSCGVGHAKRLGPAWHKVVSLYTCGDIVQSRHQPSVTLLTSPSHPNLSFVRDAGATWRTTRIHPSRPIRPGDRVIWGNVAIRPIPRSCGDGLDLSAVRKFRVIELDRNNLFRGDSYFPTVIAINAIQLWTIPFVFYPISEPILDFDHEKNINVWKISEYVVVTEKLLPLFVVVNVLKGCVIESKTSATRWSK